jgi:hypothetical protein
MVLQVYLHAAATAAPTLSGVTSCNTPATRLFFITFGFVVYKMMIAVMMLILGS